RVYELVRQAVVSGELRHAAPRHLELRESLGSLPNKGDIVVLNTSRGDAPSAVVDAAAQIVCALILEFFKHRRQPVHIGLGIGWYSYRFARSLARLLGHERKVPSLSIHALSCAWSPESPNETPISCSLYFEEAVGDVVFHGIWSVPFVASQTYAE